VQHSVTHVNKKNSIPEGLLSFNGNHSFRSLVDIA